MQNESEIDGCESARSRFLAIEGSLLGTAVGDALGLPYENLSPARARRLLGPPDRHRFLFGFGMVSDDTEHSCLVARALCESGGNVEEFRKRLASGLRWWMIGIPAGMGYATLRACLKLWLGFKPAHSGVFSAGNGPAMRSAILGAAVDDPSRLAEFVRISTRMTHTDPKAYVGALAVALAARLARQGCCDAEILCSQVRQLSPGAASDELDVLLCETIASVARRESTENYAARVGGRKGVRGYVFETVPVAIHAWLSHPHDFSAAVQSAIRCGGDTDTVAAIVGGIVGAGLGRAGIPGEWIANLCEAPRSVGWMTRLSLALAASANSGNARRAPRYCSIVVPFRNAFFLLVVLAHVVRRLLPPW